MRPIPFVLRSRRRLGFATAVLVLAAAGLADAQREQRQHQVTIAVLADGRTPVQDLTIRDIVIREDGLAREVLGVEPAPPPTHIALLIDDTQAAEPDIRDLRDALGAFVDTDLASNRAVSVGLTTFGDRPTRVFPYSQSGPLVREQVERIFARSGAGATLVDAIVFECRELEKLGAERPVIVAFVVEEGPEFSYLRHTDVETALRAANASLWPVILEGRSSVPAQTPEARERAQVLNDVARASGGAYEIALSGRGLTPAAATIARLIAGRVVVTYGRPDSLIAPDRIEVEVRRPDAEVLAPEWTSR
jgi:hypothetical protein